MEWVHRTYILFLLHSDRCRRWRSLLFCSTRAKSVGVNCMATTNNQLIRMKFVRNFWQFDLFGVCMIVESGCWSSIPRKSHAVTRCTHLVAKLPCRFEFDCRLRLEKWKRKRKIQISIYSRLQRSTHTHTSKWITIRGNGELIRWTIWVDSNETNASTSRLILIAILCLYLSA